MADPFSITGSAVGVVSLAIQLCQGLQWYISGVKDAKEKAEQIAAETEQLANLLELLESIVAKVDPSQSVSAARTGIVSCADAIATIRKKLKPDDQASSCGIKSSLRRMGKRMVFPFKEAEIKYWKDVLHTIQQSLQIALLALVIDQQRLASEDFRLHFAKLSMDSSAQHRSSLQLQRDVFDRTHLQLNGQLQILETGFSSTSQSLRHLHTNIHELQHMVQPIVSQTSYLGHLPQLQATMERMEAKLHEVSLATDSTLETDIMSLRSLQRKNRRLKRRYAKFSCTCRPQTSTTGYLSKVLALTYTRTSIHDPQCPQYLFQDAVTDLQFQATVCSLILRTKVLLSFKLTYGAGLSVKHNLECHRVVTRSSPAFKFISSLVQSNLALSQETFHGGVNKLFTMFQLGQASPHDQLPDGRTLLHELCYFASIGLSSSIDKPSLVTIENLRYLLTALLTRMRTETLETVYHGQTCVDSFMAFGGGYNLDIRLDLMKTMLKYDLQVTHVSLDELISFYRPSSFLNDHLFGSLANSLLDSSGLLETILLKSEDQLHQVLHQSNEARSLDSKTVCLALRMATFNGWMDGCKIILGADLMTYLDDAFDDSGCLLHMSARANRLDMVQFWLSQRTECERPLLTLIGNVDDALEFYINSATLSCDMEAIHLLSGYLYNVRHQIGLLMEEHGMEYCCDSARRNLPDAHVQCMLNALVRKGVDVPHHYWPKRKSLFYAKYDWNSAILQAFGTLENIGFCEIQQESLACSMNISCSPLLYLATEKASYKERNHLTQRHLVVLWFLSRGANLKETWPGSDTTALHCLAWQSGQFFRYQVGNLDPDVQILELYWTFGDFEFLIKEEILDSCVCECSSSGCDFLSCFWKILFAEEEEEEEEESWLDYSWPRFSLICDGLEYDVLTRDAEGTSILVASECLPRQPGMVILLELTLWINKAAITLERPRLIHGYICLFAFTYLELRHTCCDINCIAHPSWKEPDCSKQPYPRHSPKDLRRVENEDAHLRECLNELVPELTSQYNSFDGQLLDFVTKVLIPTMRRTAKELKQEDKALYAAGRREIGVVMCYDDDEAEDDDSEAEDEEEIDVEEESDDEY